MGEEEARLDLIHRFQDELGDELGGAEIELCGLLTSQLPSMVGEMERAFSGGGAGLTWCAWIHSAVIVTALLRQSAIPVNR